MTRPKMSRLTHLHVIIELWDSILCDLLFVSHEDLTCGKTNEWHKQISTSQSELVCNQNNQKLAEGFALNITTVLLLALSAIGAQILPYIAFFFYFVYFAQWCFK